MGKNSTIKAKCILTFSVTNAAYRHVRRTIKFSDFTRILEEKSKGCIKVTRSYWNNDNAIGALVGTLLLGIVGWSYPSMVYEMDIDTFNLVRKNSNRLVANSLKICKNKRDEIILKKLKGQIEDGFQEKLSEQAFSSLAITLRSVTVSKCD